MSRNDVSFVLIPGAWSGAWVWEPVRRALLARGHRALGITLPGLEPGEGDVSAIGLSTHVEHVLRVLEAEDVRDGVLVGHSYSGIVAGQVADRAGGRVAHTVFVQAFLPLDGESLLDAFPEEARAAELAAIERGGGRWPPPSAEEMAAEPDLTPAQVEYLAARMTPHPGRTVSEPAVLTRPLAEQRATYVASRMEARGLDRVRESDSWTFLTIDAGHWPMLSQPEQTAELLSGIASASNRRHRAGLGGRAGSGPRGGADPEADRR